MLSAAPFLADHDLAKLTGGTGNWAITPISDSLGYRFWGPDQQLFMLQGLGEIVARGTPPTLAREVGVNRSLTEI